MNYTLNFVCISIFTLLIGCKSSDQDSSEFFWSDDKSPEHIGRLVSGELFTREDFMMYITSELTTLHYAEACAAFGVTRLAGLLNDSLTIDRIIARYGHVIDSGLISDVGHVDINVYGILPLEIYLHTKEEKYLNEGIRLADHQWEDPLPNGMSNQTRYWIDDVYMIASLQTQAYRATGNEIYLERAALEVNAYLEKLQQSNGLFHHGENAPFFWGRGNGWVAAGLAELISVLPESNPYYDSIIVGYKQMMASLLKYQAEDGMWRQMIDYPDSWKETSSTAMFGFAIAQGVKKNILDDPVYTMAYQKAWLALCDYVDDEGKLGDVCVGTGQSTDADYYLQRPRTKGDFHGQAPMLWFAWSLLSQ